MTKTILITGGARGIGEAVVRAAAGKYNVAFTYLTSESRARSLERELNSEFGGVFALECDVSDEASVRSAVRSVKARFKRVDILVNNAGVSKCGMFLDMTPAEWRSLMSVNLDGAYLVTREVLPDMLSRRSGAVVNVSSIWGLRGASCEVAYSASKAALIGFTKALAKEVAPMGVTVNAVAPGAIDTDMMKCYTADEVSSLISDHIPMDRLGAPADVASAILFLAEHPYISAHVLSVDGAFC